MPPTKDQDDEWWPPLRDVDNPTAGFPIGALGGLHTADAPPSADPDRDPGADREVDTEDTFEVPDGVDPGSQRAGGDRRESGAVEPDSPRRSRVHPVVLVLSLVGGGALALAVVALIGMLLLLG